MSKRRLGYPSEAQVKRGERAVKGGEKEFSEKLGNNDLWPVRFRTPLSSAAAGTAGAFDGAGRQHYLRER